MTTKTEIFSVYGEMEALAAEIMIRDGEATRINADKIPPFMSFNDRGDRVRFAVVVSGDKVAKFERLIADLRA